jgi:misacylated tRNA(Ala) deacylase
MTERLFLQDSQLRETKAVVVSAGPEGIVLDRTIFYGRSGGQPGDSGVIAWSGGEARVTEAVKGEGENILHPVGEALLPAPGTAVRALIDWERRHRLMRMHTALHLLCSVLPGAGVTGGQIGTDRSRLDFDLPEPPAKEALEERLAAVIAGDHPVRAEWVDESVLDINPALVRTLSVKPPRGTGRLRLVRIGVGDPPIDLQPCGGTHVASTAEIGKVAVQKIENKGRQNRRITIVFAEGA